MTNNLFIDFTDSRHAVVRLEPAQDGIQLNFASPVTRQQLRDISWYVEVYGQHAVGAPDDAEAARIETLLRTTGEALFAAVFSQPEAFCAFMEFYNCPAEERILTISAANVTIQMLPWELLAAPVAGFLSMQDRAINVRRRVGASTSLSPSVRETLHLLFLVSRPVGPGFLDPRGDALPILDALDENVDGLVTVEFLYPPTVASLSARLEDEAKPSIDIVHFDGHGAFDSTWAPSPEQLLDSAQCPSGMGYLVFEDDARCVSEVSGHALGSLLAKHNVRLAILSACQSATVAELGDEHEDRQPALGSVATSMIARGVPSVLAMMHSVLAYTTGQLFGRFYGELSRYKTVEESLDSARRLLFEYPEKCDSQRGRTSVRLRLQDWFVPVLFQSGANTPLLARVPRPQVLEKTTPEPGNVPQAPTTGFVGRYREMWEVERSFAEGTRRITLTGFGGQGKTALAQELARWLPRTGMFRFAVFIDYSSIQPRDPIGAAVATIGTVLGVTLIDSHACVEALKAWPTLIVLDNLEALPRTALDALLGIAADWSEAGASRLLCTTRYPDLDHPAYPLTSSKAHRPLQLRGLGSREAPSEALQLFDALTKLQGDTRAEPPPRVDVVDLADRVGFHPLSIRILTELLRTQPISELKGRLADALNAAPLADVDIVTGLAASLSLSMQALSQPARQLLIRLSVFRGGAFLDSVIAVALSSHTSLVRTLTRPSSQALEECRAVLHDLQAAALVEIEQVRYVSVPFVRLHPSLGPVLWAQVSQPDKAYLNEAHAWRYFMIAQQLASEDHRDPLLVRAAARREIGNMLDAVHRAIDTDSPWAAEFVSSINYFLGVFGFREDQAAVNARLQLLAANVGSDEWYLATQERGTQLLAESRIEEALQVFTRVLEKIGSTEALKRAKVSGQLAECHTKGGRPAIALQYADDAIAVAASLGETRQAMELHLPLYMVRGDALAAAGRHSEAATSYDRALELAGELHSPLHAALISVNRGNLDVASGRPANAAERYQNALEIFIQLGDRVQQAVVWHQLGVVAREAGRWEEAERNYRESARLEAELGNVGGAAQTWNDLAHVADKLGKIEAAEDWYRQCIEASRTVGLRLLTATGLHNLAGLVAREPRRRAEALALAEEALAIKETLDPHMSKLWTTHHILAEIYQREAITGDASSRAMFESRAGEHRRRAVETRPGSERPN